MEHTVKNTAIHNGLNVKDFEDFCRKNMKKYSLQERDGVIYTTTLINTKLIPDFEERPRIIYFNELSICDELTKKITDKIMKK